MYKEEEFFNSIKEFSALLDEHLETGRLTQYEYNEMKTLDIDITATDFLDPTKRFKELFVQRSPIKCSKLLLAIYDKHKSSFRKAVLLSECFPDPLGYKYSDEIHDFSILVIKKARTLALERQCPKELVLELEQLYFALKFFHHNNIKNTEKLNECEFMNYSLSEQIRMICLFMQDQSRLEDALRSSIIKENGFLTGMEGAVSNRAVEGSANTVVSLQDNFEGLVDAYDILIRYIYYKKHKDYKKKTIPEHGDITHIKIPSFEEITYLSIQRNLLVKTWEKFKYSRWDICPRKEDDQECFIFSPQLMSEYRQHIIAGNRRNYFLMLDIFDKIQRAGIVNTETVSNDFYSALNKDNIESLFLLDKEHYGSLAESYRIIIDTYKSNMHSYYLELTLGGLKIEDILKAVELLYVLADCYKNFIYKDFAEDDNASYKYLCPIIPIQYFIHALIEYFGFSEEYATKLLHCFTFEPGIKGESDIFSRPLICANSENIIFCPAFIHQINIERLIEMLVSNFSVNIARIGTDFEAYIRTVLSYFKGISVNTNKIAFLASDGRDVEFDFIGTFDNHMLLWEFKATTTPYSEKKRLECRDVLMEGVAQIERRCKILKTDWEKIRELANIELPEKPFSDDKVIKIVGTNIFDFTTLTYGQDIIIIDESTLLKFFISPEVRVKDVASKTPIVAKRLWEKETPTVFEFKKYLENPVTISPYNECIEIHPKVFKFFADEYPYIIIDHVLTKDPYEQEIKNALQSKQPHSAKQKKKAKKKRRK